MHKFTFLAFCLMTSLSLRAQTTLPYYTGFNDSSEQAGWTQYRLGAGSNPSYQWEFTTNSLLHFYPVGGTDVTDDWMVSPPFDFANGGMIDSLRYRFAGFGTPFGVDTIALYVLTDHPHPDTASSQTIIRLYTDSTYLNDNVWRTDSALAVPAHNGSSYLAFRYKTIVNWLDATIDDLYIDGSSVSIEQAWLAQNLRLYPNPSDGWVQLELSKQAAVEGVELLSLAGETIALEDQGNYTFDLRHLAAGTYFIRLQTEERIFYQKLMLY
ncbi:MAG: T9SS type A sorting domain-containing protein [Bacteroidota bacterium]